MKTIVASGLLALALAGCTTTTPPHAAPVSPVGTTTATAPHRPTVEPASDESVFDVVLPEGHGRLLGSGQVALGSEVPWSQVGPGWRLTLLQQGKQHADVFAVSAQMLDLIAPSGARYQLFKSSTQDVQPWRLDDWSSDGRTALLSRGDTGRFSFVVAVDLRTGKQLSLRIPRLLGALLRQDGSGVWVTSGVSKVRSISWDGTVTTHPLGGAMIQAPDGRLVTSGRSGLTILDQGGQTTRVPTPLEKCHAIRWWSPGVVLTQCATNKGIRLLAIPLDGSRPIWISKPHATAAMDLGEYDAYLLDGTTYLQVAGACGYTFLGRQNADGSITDVDPPHAIGNVTMQGVERHSLLVTHEMSCEPPGPPVQVLAAYDPVARTERVLTTLPEGEQFAQILAYDSPIAVGW